MAQNDRPDYKVLAMLAAVLVVGAVVPQFFDVTGFASSGTACLNKGELKFEYSVGTGLKVECKFNKLNAHVVYDVPSFPNAVKIMEDCFTTKLGIQMPQVEAELKRGCVQVKGPQDDTNTALLLLVEDARKVGVAVPQTVVAAGQNVNVAFDNDHTYTISTSGGGNSGVAPCPAVGECAPGNIGYVCIQSGSLPRVAQFYAPSQAEQVCGDNLDNDCDGTIDCVDSSCIGVMFWASADFAGTMGTNIATMTADAQGNAYVALQSTGAWEVRKYDGASWTSISLPGISEVRSVAVDRLGKIYIGAYDSSDDMRKVFKYDGTSWTATGIASPYTIDSLVVDSSNNVYTVIDDTSGGGNVYTVYKYNGTSWSSTGTVSPSVSDLQNLAADDLGNVYIRGYDNVLNRVDIFKYDGTSWVSLAFPSYYSYAGYMTADSAGNVYVAGGDQSGPAVLKYGKNTGTWSSLGSFAGVMGVSQIAVDSSGNVYAVGMVMVIFPLPSYDVYMYDGASWISTGLSGLPQVSGIVAGGQSLYVAGRDSAYNPIIDKFGKC